MREVLGEIGAGEVPELVVINKADAADPIDGGGAAAGRAAQPWWCRPGPATGWTTCSPSDRAALPRRDREVSVVVPYDRGDLVARAHQEGEVLALRHGADGTELTARVPPGLAAELDRIAVPAGS